MEREHDWPAARGADAPIDRRAGSAAAGGAAGADLLPGEHAQAFELLERHVHKIRRKPGGLHDAGAAAGAVLDRVHDALQRTASHHSLLPIWKTITASP